MNGKEKICVVYEKGCTMSPFVSCKRTLPFFSEMVCDDVRKLSCIPYGEVDILFIVFTSNTFLDSALPVLCALSKHIRIMLFTEQLENGNHLGDIMGFSRQLIGVSYKRIDAEDLSYIAHCARKEDGFLQLYPSSYLNSQRNQKKQMLDATLDLTDRELEVLILIAEGASNRIIADVLFISENTAKTHVRRVLEKLQLNSRTKAALYAINAGVTKHRPPLIGITLQEE